MKIQRSIIAFALGFGMCQFAFAQAPAGAPAGSTGQCKDGSYTNAPKKMGACRGHKGVQQWFAADTSAPASSTKDTKSAASAPATSSTPEPAAPAAAPATAPACSPKTSSTSNMAQAPGVGPGMVWVNTPTNVYHCAGSRYYGKTKEGKYMTEAQAKAAGAHPDHGKGCGQ